MRRPIITLIILGSELVAGGRGRAEPPSAATALVRGDYQAAIEAADAGLAADPKNGRLHYEKGCALVDLGRFDEGIVELRSAQQLFAGVHEKGLALYRVAVALETAHRCPEAQRAFVGFIELVRATEPASAELARHESETCGLPPATAR
jgi:tetratricopeptide (TPR) repeat protein